MKFDLIKLYNSVGWWFLHRRGKGAKHTYKEEKEWNEYLSDYVCAGMVTYQTVFLKQTKHLDYLGNKTLTSNQSIKASQYRYSPLGQKMVLQTNDL